MPRYDSIKANDGKTYIFPMRPICHDGPPPSVGWWPASIWGFSHAIRWWDGSQWSNPALPKNSEIEAMEIANMKDVNNLNYIQWSDRWWE